MEKQSGIEIINGKADEREMIVFGETPQGRYRGRLMILQSYSRNKRKHTIGRLLAKLKCILRSTREGERKESEGRAKGERRQPIVFWEFKLANSKKTI